MKTKLIAVAIACTGVVACNNNTKQDTAPATQENEITEMETPAEQSLKEQLDAKRANFNAKASDEKKDAYQRGIEDIIDNGVLDNAKNTGDIAPAFTLKNAVGQEVSLASYLEKGPVVLTWYRGGWCPYCNLTLKSLQDHLPEFKAEGANLLALTPELPDKSMDTQEKNALDFEVLTDLNNNVAREYGIVFKVIDDVNNFYKPNFDIAEYNGNDSQELPLAATYIINTDGTIAYTFLDADYRNRAEPSEIIEELKKLNQ